MDQEIALSPTASNIICWLQGHPDEPTAYAIGTDGPLVQNCSLLKPAAKRKVLNDISGNAMPEKRRRLSPSKADNTTFEEPQTPLPSDRIPYYISQNDDDTPRALEDGANLRRPRATNYAFSAGQTSPSRSSTSSARSHSPIKRMGDLQFMDRSINAVAFENTKYPLPAAAEKLLEDMTKIASGKQVIPDNLKVWYSSVALCLYMMLIAIQLHAEELISKGKLDEYNFGAKSNILIPDQPPGSHSDEEVWKRVSEVIYQARLCEENSSSEPAWNTEVHARILNLVLLGWREEWCLCYNDV
jgi:hypothetical protein